MAIKTILTGKLSAESARMATVRFEREVRAVARLNHGNVVQVYDFGAEGDLAYIVMEFIQGRELKDYFDANQRFDLKTIFRLIPSCSMRSTLRTRRASSTATSSRPT